MLSFYFLLSQKVLLILSHVPVLHRGLLHDVGSIFTLPEQDGPAREPEYLPERPRPVPHILVRQLCDILVLQGHIKQKWDLVINFYNNFV